MLDPLEDTLQDLEHLFPITPRSVTPPDTLELYDREPESLRIHLVGQHPLWGHHLWNASKVFASFLDQKRDQLCKAQRVLELGAGGGLPGLIAACNGAETVLLTDYPDPDLIRNLEKNVHENLSGDALKRTSVQGFIWGANPAPLTTEGRFDLVILSDLVFNHSQHQALLKTCGEVLKQRVEGESWTPCALVFFTHHRPWLAEQDLAFFTMARSMGWTCEEVLEVYTGAMFAEDRGDERVRGTVHGWRMWRSALAV